MSWEVRWTLSFRGRRSRNKVSVGEPAEGSLKIIQPTLWIVFEGTSASFLDEFVSSPSHTHPINLRVWSLPFLSPLLLRREEKEVLTEITLNNGCLGSRNDEERSEMRYVVWFALSVNHRIFERILHSRLRPRVCLPERQCVSSPHFYFWAWIWASGIFCFIERLGSPEKQSYVRLSHNQRGRPLRWTIVRFDSCLPKYDLDRIYFRVETCAFLLRTFSFKEREQTKKASPFDLSSDKITRRI